MSEKAPKIMVSTNYSQFKFAEFNRKISKGNVSILIKENEKENHFKYFPIIVDEFGVIIDGQHRFTACQKMGLPVYYIVKGEPVSVDQIKAVNAAGKRHNRTDYLLMESKNGNKDAQYIIDIANLFKCSYSTAIALVANKKQGGKQSKKIREGIFDIRDKGEVESFGNILITIVNGQIKDKHVSVFTSIETETGKKRVEVARDLQRNGFIIDPKWPKPTLLLRIVTTYNFGKAAKNRITGVI